ncbi:NACHT domain-containing protein [Streptomyces tauricus]|uniref:NACHT domain-containing protein n=2 Tax=Streptomyces tauricus TaxID=68274 RepID=A0ABZ1JEQ8_9ACTN|nr:NACHT domain-containing protein [Streptomyces tauricus]
MAAGERGSRVLRRWALGSGGSLLVIGGLGWALSADEGALELSERTDLTAMAVALVGLVTWAAALWPSPGAHEDETAAVARLVREVRSAGEIQWASSLGGDLTAIDVTFRFRPYGSARAALLPPTPAGQLARAVEDYRALRPRRLVITGEAGAGKTVLARKLVMELLRVRTDREPVPVLMALADWDEDERLTDWMARHLRSDYGLHPRSADLLVDSRLVLPVLDGLDEMDAADVPVERSRAQQALAALARHQEGTDPAPLVLTCRAKQYDALEAADSHILDAARIEIEPVTPERTADFLELRGAARRPALWQPVLDELRAEPEGVLARSLSTPWRLTLAATVYERGCDPRELNGLSAESEVADVLLSRYIESADRITPKAPGRYRQGDVHRWLHTLAVQLGAGASAETDILLLELGSRQGGAAVRVVCRSVTVALMAVIAWVAWSATASTPMAWADILLVPALVVLNEMTGRRLIAPLTWGAPPLGSGLWRLGFRLFLRGMSCASVLSLTALALWVVLMSLYTDWMPVRILALTSPFVVLFCVNGAASWIDRAATGPFGVIRSGIPILGTTALVATLFVVDGGMTPAAWLMASSAGLVAAAKMPGQLEYLAYLLVYRRQVPLRLARFLTWATDAGLMRTSGLAYQFRHREFQEWLVRHPEPVSVVPPVTPVL